MIYSEDFSGDGDFSIVGWEGVFDGGGSSGGVAGDFAWVWHNGDCGNIIFTNEFTIDTSENAEIQFDFYLRRHSYYTSTPAVSIAVQAGGQWYVSNETFEESATTFAKKSLVFDPQRENWYIFNMSSLTRGAVASGDLSGDITAFGFYSDSSNVGSSCTAEYDNFTVHDTISLPDPEPEASLQYTPDFNLDGLVNYFDYNILSENWLYDVNSLDFLDECDLNDDDSIDILDMAIFAEEWLIGGYQFAAAEHNRQKVFFNTGWLFYRGEVPGKNPEEVSYDDSSWEQVILPHNPPMNPPEPDPLRPTWPDYSYEGVSWYRKHFTVSPEYECKKIFMEFEAVNTVADVWINGNHLTTHYGGYLPFSVDVTGYINFGATQNVIAVKADNSDNSEIPIGNDGWFNWGGIYRDVWLHVTDKLHVSDAVYADVPAGGGIFVTYPYADDSQAQVQIRTHVQNEYAELKHCTVESVIVDSDNKVIGYSTTAEEIGGGGEHSFEQMIVFNNPALWHPDQPNLYTLHTQVYDDNNCVDDYQTKIGVRRFEFSHEEGFKINGEKLYFMGANRMQDYPYTGYAMSDSQQYADAKKLKEGGFQFIRTSQYPEDGAFLDACDELGLLVMAPIPGFQHFSDTDMFKNISYQNMRDLMRRDRNRPCVIAWELSLNETNFTSEYAQTAVNIGHEEYPGDQCYVAGWKYDYIYDIFIATPSAGARTYSGSKPFIVSEYGHWEYGGDAGTSDAHRADDIGDKYAGGEEAMLQQAWNHQEGLHLNRGVDYIAGDGLWCGMDLACYPSGSLDTFRLPKFSYYFYQSQRSPSVMIDGIDSGPMVFIANYWTSSSPRDVRVYSNCDEVKLYINDVLEATHTPDTDYPTANLLHPPFTFKNLTWQTGQLKAEGYIGGQSAATHTVRTPEAASVLSVSYDCDELQAGGDMTFVHVSVLDGNGTLAVSGSNLIYLGITGPAVLVSPGEIQAEAGIATFLIRTTAESGVITVSATSSGLDGDIENITSVPMSE